MIFDQYEAGAEHFIGFSSIVDTLTKQSAITALARQIYNVSTRSIDKSVRCSVRNAKIQRRSIGKNDGSQYITNDKWLAEELWDKQRNQPFRKGQRLLVTDTRIKRNIDLDGRIYTITKDTMLVVDTVPIRGKRIKLRIWNTKYVFESEVSYQNDLKLEAIRVRPANIILINEVRYHKFPNTVLVVNNELTPREKYVLLKNTHNLVVGT